MRTRRLLPVFLLALVFSFSAFSWKTPAKLDDLKTVLIDTETFLDSGSPSLEDIRRRVNLLVASPEELQAATAFLILKRGVEDPGLKALKGILVTFATKPPTLDYLEPLGLETLFPSMGVVFSPEEFAKGTQTGDAILKSAAYFTYTTAVGPFANAAFKARRDLTSRVKIFKKNYARVRYIVTGAALCLEGYLAKKCGMHFDIESHPKESLEKVSAGLAATGLGYKFIYPKIKGPWLKRYYAKEYNALVDALVEFASFDPEKNITHMLGIATQNNDEFRLFEDAAFDALIKIDSKESSDGIIKIISKALEANEMDRVKKGADIIISRHLHSGEAAKELATMINDAFLHQKDIRTAAARAIRRYQLKLGLVGTTLTLGTGGILGTLHLLGIDPSHAVILGGFIVHTIGTGTLLNMIRGHFWKDVKNNVPGQIAQKIESLRLIFVRMSERDSRMIPLVGAFSRAHGKVDEWERMAAENALELLAPAPEAIDEMKALARVAGIEGRVEESDRYWERAMEMSVTLPPCPTAVGASGFSDVEQRALEFLLKLAA